MKGKLQREKRRNAIATARLQGELAKIQSLHERDCQQAIENLDKNPWRGVNTFCHEGAEVEMIVDDNSYLYDYIPPHRPPVGSWVAFVCTHSEWGHTREEAVSKLIAWVRSELQKGNLGC